MKFPLIILTIILVVAANSQLSSQIISKVDYNKYNHMGSTYEFQEMDGIFVSKLEAYHKYNSALKARKATYLFGKITLIAMAMGTLAPIVNFKTSCDSVCFTPGLAIGIISWILVVPTFGTIGLIKRFTYNKRMDSTISLFNGSSDIGNIGNPEQWNLKIGGGQHGYGIVFNF